MTSTCSSSDSTSSVFILTRASRFPISLIKFPSLWIDSNRWSLSASARTRLGDDSRRPSLLSPLSLNSSALTSAVRARLIYVCLMSVSVLVSFADSSIASKKSLWTILLSGSCYRISKGSPRSCFCIVFLRVEFASSFSPINAFSSDFT